jgi:catechol 2,3-dioxygenase-like lactoylglutathione lyase family enzyme
MNFDTTTKILLGIIAAGIWAGIIILILPKAAINKVAKAQNAPQPTKPKTFKTDYNTLTVHRLNVVNEKGQLQWVIADSSRFPPPIVNGKVYHDRSISPHGVLFYDYKGNEAGGIAFSHKFQQHAMILDYHNSDGMGFGVDDNRPKSYNAGFFIRDPVPLGADITKRKGGSTNTERVLLRDKNGNAALVLRDKQGNARIKLEVSKTGEAFFEILDPAGNVVRKISGKALKNIK